MVMRTQGSQNAMAGGFAAKVRRLTGGRAVDVLYDSVGRAPFEENLAALCVRGRLVV